MRTCGPADRLTGKLRTKPAYQVRSLPVGRSAGPHYLYVFHPWRLYYNCVRRSIPTELHLLYGITQVKGGYITLYGKPISELWSVTCHMASVICATSAMLWSCHLSRKDVGRTATALTRSWVECKNCSCWHHCRCVGYYCEAFVCELCWQFFIDIWRFTCLTASSFWSYYEKNISIFRPIDLKTIFIFRL